MNMPTKDRKYYIRKHNEMAKSENDSGYSSSLSDDEMMDMGLM